MPNPDAVVSTTILIEPPLDRAAAEILRAEDGLSVLLEGERIVRLDPDDPRSPGFAQALDARSLTTGASPPSGATVPSPATCSIGGPPAHRSLAQVANA